MSHESLKWWQTDRAKEAKRALHQKSVASLRTDPCSADGAYKLKAQIERYWAARGKSVQVEVVGMGFNPKMRGVSYFLRSDMKNGLPTPNPKTKE